MTKTFSRYIAFALVLVLLFTLAPQAFAAQTTGSVMLFDQASPNYTITLNSQVAIKYKPNGTGSSTTAYLKNIGWHYARYGGVAYPDKPIYCIEPNKNFNSSSSGNSMDTGVTVGGSGYTQGQSTWYAMPESYRRAITLILLYSDQLWDDSYSVTTTYRDSNPNTPLRLATQFLIYEIVTGLRDANSFVAYGNGYEDGDVLYNAGLQVSNFAPNYNSLVSLVQNAMTLPSFVGSSSSTAPTIDLDEDSVLTWMHDDNGVMSNFTFTGDDNVNFNPYGNDLCIERIGDISSSKVYSCYRDVPSPDNSTVALYYGNTSYQVCVSLHTPSSGRLTGYFKLNAPVSTGNFNIIKQTSDGQNLSGWKFSLYFDANCTQLFSGPYATSSTGRISFTGTTPGTYYIKEIGHTDAAIEAKYTCTSANPQKIVVTAGQTSSVTFTNTLRPGSLSIKKTTSDGKNLSGWQFSIYSNSACTSLVSGPHTSDSSGAISISGLTAGTYYVKEIGHQTASIASQYTCSSTNPQTVTITAGGTSSVSFTNTLRPGSLSIKKTTSDGKNLSGWQFSIYSNAACTSLVSGPHTTNSSGTISVSNLSAGTIYVKETGHTDADIAAQYVCTSTNPQAVTITAGGSASVTFNNNLNLGSVKIVKQTNTGKNLAGWQIGLYTDSACNSPIIGSPFTTGNDGTIMVPNLQTQRLYAKEISSGNSYWVCDSSVKTVDVAAGQTTTITFTNTHYGRIQVVKTTNTGENLEGWEFIIKDDDGNEVGTYTSGPDGTVTTGNLPIGDYMVIEKAIDDDFWQTPLGWHDVTVEGGKTTKDSWHNVEQGLAWIYKQTNTGEALSGWEITIYSDEACTQEVHTLTTNEDGRVGYYIDPGIYWAAETGDTEGRFDSEYWLVDERVQEFEVKPHEETAITFTNVQYGKLKIIKSTSDHSSVEGWEFKVTDSSGKELDGSPFTTSTDGTILITTLPGDFTIEEILPNDSPYQVDGENPRTVTVRNGETAEVTFINCLNPGKITITKVDTNKEPLAGAKFRLEWSVDGTAWQPVEYAEDGELKAGFCGNPNVDNGCLISGEDGVLEWDNLYPGLYYRVMEQKAPDGYILLTEAAYEGQLIGEDLEVNMRVINGEGFTLPDTGSSEVLFLGLLFTVCIATFCTIVLPYHRRRTR